MTSPTAISVPLSQWCRVKSDEYPPVAEVVWTTDGSAVRSGAWFWDAPYAPLKSGIWKDSAGLEMTVTHWLPLEESELPPQIAAA